MDQVVDFIVMQRSWVWLILGLLLIAGEMLIPGVYLIWIGVAGLAVGTLSFFWSGLGIYGEFICFAIATIALLLTAGRYFYGKAGGEETGLNARLESYVGHHFVVVRSVHHGQGHIQIGDSLWPVEGPACEAGEMVEVVGIEAGILQVKPSGSGAV